MQEAVEHHTQCIGFHLDYIRRVEGGLKSLAFALEEPGQNSVDQGSCVLNTAELVQVQCRDFLVEYPTEVVGVMNKGSESRPG